MSFLFFSDVTCKRNIRRCFASALLLFPLDHLHIPLVRSSTDLWSTMNLNAAHLTLRCMELDSNKKLLGTSALLLVTSASLLVTSALLVVTRSY